MLISRQARALRRRVLGKMQVTGKKITPMWRWIRKRIGETEDGSIALYKITVEEYFQSKTEPSNKKFHNLRYIEKIADNIGGRTSEKNRSGGSTNDISTINYSVSNLFSFVKKYDPEFNPNASSKIVNEDGTPMKVYHGSAQKFTVFEHSI